VREDAIALFGFRTALELQLFERLIAVSGIGPKVALAVLSGIEPPDLVHAIQQSDVARLTSIPGVGKKTAERIVLELKDKIASVPGVAPPLEAAASNGAMRDDLLSALINLGYHRPAAEKAVEKALHAEPAAGFERALRGALKHLSR
jgi:Holliday junction DNA helicase RuvA